MPITRLQHSLVTAVASVVADVERSAGRSGVSDPSLPFSRRSGSDTAATQPGRVPSPVAGSSAAQDRQAFAEKLAAFRPHGPDEASGRAIVATLKNLATLRGQRHGMALLDPDLDRASLFATYRAALRANDSAVHPDELDHFVEVADYALKDLRGELPSEVDEASRVPSSPATEFESQIAADRSPDTIIVQPGRSLRSRYVAPR